MSYNPNGSREWNRIKPPVYAPVNHDNDKKQVKLLISHTQTPEGWGTKGHYTEAATSWRLRG